MSSRSSTRVRVRRSTRGSVLVVSEDPWNRAMNTSVIVPLYPLEEIERATDLLVAIDSHHYADCTLVQSLDEDDIGEEITECEPEPLSAVGFGLGVYLDIDDLIGKRIRRPPTTGRGDFWPRQREIYWAARFGDQRERYAGMPSDEFNVRSNHTAMLFLTLRDKSWRSRWQVPRDGGYVVSGDIDQFDYRELDERLRPDPRALSRPEMAEVAHAVAEVLQLRP
jgi:mRNA-degrading endonuclease toxin of MazEF toxin-antitoxin module